MFDVARAMPRLRFALTAAAAAWVAGWVLVIGAHEVAGHSESAVSHSAHALMDSLDTGFAVNVDHPHLNNGSSAPHPERSVTAVVPRSATTLHALMLVGVVAAAAVAGWLALRGVPPGRGPPTGPATVLDGQDRLIRLSLSRR